MTADVSPEAIIAEHTVRIHRDRLEFTCHGDENADCHRYPDCECETWDDDHESEYGHPRVPHDECWMQPWFDNDGVLPRYDELDDVYLDDRHSGYQAGMWGPVKVRFEEEYIDWEFIDPTKAAAS